VLPEAHVHGLPPDQSPTGEKLKRQTDRPAAGEASHG
jgi:hypothetical protein